MQKSRLIEVLQSFSGREMQQFEQYLSSPYHNTQSDLVRLYKHIVFALQQKIEAALGKEYVYEKLFPKRPYKDVKIHFTIRSKMHATVYKKSLLTIRPHNIDNHSYMRKSIFFCWRKIVR